MPRSAKSTRSSKSGKSRKSRSRRSYSRALAPRTSRTVRGHGDYTYHNPGAFGKVGRFLGYHLGNYLGGSSAAKVGEQLGGLAHYIGRIFGSGDYKIGAAPVFNSLFVGAKGSQPSISFGEKTIRFRHKEYLQDIMSSPTAGAFANQTFAINPGLYGSFPFLSAIAQNFQVYRMHGCAFEFKSMSANALNSVNTALGSVVCCVDYNAASGPFVGKQDMLNSFGAIDGKPSDSIFVGVECDTSKLPISELYVRRGALPAGQDIKMYDMGVFNIASTGCQGTNVNLGELHVMYDVEFMLPVINGIGQADSTSLINFAIGTIGTGIIPNYSSSLPALNGGVLNVYDNIGLEIGFVSGQGTSIAFPNSTAGGVYRIVIQWTGASTALVAGPSISVVSGLQLLSDLEAPPSGQTTNRLVCSYTVRVPNSTDGLIIWDNILFPNGNPGNGWPRLRLNVGGGIVPSTLTSITLSVVRLNPDILQTPFILNPAIQNTF